MLNGFEERCLCCGCEISEFTNTTGFMRCPRAYDESDAILSLMPKFKTEKEMNEAITILEKGGYEMNSRRFNGNTAFYPIILVVKNLAERLMKYEPIMGARHHDFNLVCAKCVEKLSRCQECGKKQSPRCPICEAELVIL